ncbi:MAG: Cof-type HAD-IIB family hydrolase [Candidatus Dormibacteraceae bacterium]
MNPIRLLALDLDGTVVSSDLKVDDRDVEALARAEAAGITVVACTGRPFPGAMIWVKRLGLHGPFVCYQGAEIRTPDGGMLLDHGLPHDVAVRVVRFCEARDIHVQAYRSDELIVAQDRPEARDYAHHAGMEMHVVGDLGKAIGETTPKLVIVAPQATVDRMLPEIQQEFAGEIYAATSMPTYLEVTSVRANKSRALATLCERLGIDRAQTAAAGDGRNDVPMLEWARYGVAIAGSRPEVLEAAQGRTVAAPGGAGMVTLVDALLGHPPAGWAAP